MLLGELSTSDRQKIMTICTIDVHARDIVSRLIAQKVMTIETTHKLDFFFSLTKLLTLVVKLNLLVIKVCKIPYSVYF